MYNGLPLGRTEVLDNGTEYYLNLDKDGFVTVRNNSFSNNGAMEVINPFSGMGITRMPININERLTLINKAREGAIFNAPLNSYARNPIFEGVGIDISPPSLSSLPTASTPSNTFFESVPDVEALEALRDTNITPKPRPIPLDIENPFE
jgi:hypothetical protein